MSIERGHKTYKNDLLLLFSIIQTNIRVNLVPYFSK